MYNLFGLINVILGHHYVTILMVKKLIWAPFSQSMCTFSFLLTPVLLQSGASTNWGSSDVFQSRASVIIKRGIFSV